MVIFTTGSEWLFSVLEIFISLSSELQLLSERDAKLKKAMHKMPNDLNALAKNGFIIEGILLF
jgi:hypothetical protein